MYYDDDFLLLCVCTTFTLHPITQFALLFSTPEPHDSDSHQHFPTICSSVILIFSEDENVNGK